MNSSTCTKADSLPLSFDYSCSAVSSKDHFCGSLFAKCAQHGKWQLLQTFTNRESDLSQETFSDVYSPRIIRRSYEPVRESRKGESNYSYGNFTASKSEAQHMPPYLTDENLPGIASQRDGKKNKNRVKFANKTFECKCLNAGRYGHMRHYSFPVCKNFPSKRILSDLREITASPSIPEEDFKSYPQPEYKCNTFTNDAKKLDKMFIKVRDDSNTEDRKDHQQKFSNRYVLQRSIPKDRIINLEKENATHKNRSYNNAERDAISDVFWDQQDGQMANGNLRRDQRQTSSLRSAISQRTESTPFENEIDFLETEIVLLRRELKKKDVENVKLQMEIDKLKLRLCQQSVLNETSVFKYEGDLLSSIHDSHGMPGQVQQVVNIPNPNKKQGVSGESSNHGENHHQIEIQRFEKDFRSKQLIKDAIMENNFLKNLDMSQVREIVESVYPKEFSKDDYVIREGEAGSHLFVSAEGELEVIKGEKVLGNMGPGKAFGELAILYNCRRTASIKVVSDAKVWVLDRQVFQKIVMKTGLQRLQENLNFLRSVPLLKSLSTEVLAKIADVLEVDFYQSGEHIIRQGATGDTFFIISSGSVKVTQDQRGKEDEEIRILKKGDYFGEQALLKEDWRTANVIALSPGVECLTLNRDSFIQLIGDLSELQEKDYGDQIRGFVRPSSASNLSDKQEYDYIRLQDLEVINTLGVGGFGRVELVQYTKNRGMTFALKCLKKQHIVETKQQEHVYSEKNIMMSCNSLFICRLYKTFRDSKYVYMLQEALLGGEVWTILREKGCFDDYTTKFVTGCVIEAFEYLHTRGIVYRDLKPENLLLDNKGYIKLVDFGFSKRIGFSSKTWTFCGTPEYLAPEIILNKGHDRAVDYWSLGILMHELLTGIPPFTATDPMRTYTFILKGIDMIDFPKHITKRAQSLIKRLCRDAPSERLGYQRGGIQDIKRHKWFQGFDWEGLKQRILIPPVSPSVTSSTDTSNFDCYSKETSLPPDEFSNWDAEF